MKTSFITDITDTFFLKFSRSFLAKTWSELYIGVISCDNTDVQDGLLWQWETSIVPRTWEWAVSDMSLNLLDAIGDGWPDAGDEWVDGKDRYDDQWDGNDKREPEQRRRRQHTHCGLVLWVQRPYIGQHQVAEEEVEEAAAPHCNMIE